MIEWGLRYAGRAKGKLDVDFPMAYPDNPPDADAQEAAEAFWNRLGIGAHDEHFIACFFGTLGRQFELETVIGSDFQHVQVNLRILVPRKSDMTDLSRFLRRNYRFIGPPPAKYPVRIIEADDFVMLN